MKLKVYVTALVCIGIVSLISSAPAIALPGEQTTVLKTRSGASETVIYNIVSGAPASVILLPGGNGVLSQVSGNFLMRVRDQFVSQGLSIAVPNVPSDHSSGMDLSFRSSAEHAKDLDAVIDFLQNASPGPVWLVGTSNGSVSAANGAARLGSSRVAGLVLTSSVWATGMRSVPLDKIAVPTLIVHNRDDGCNESPYQGASQGLARLAKAPAKELISVQGGQSAGAACGAMSPHGYLGIENQVVPPIIEWIKSHTT
ncbi:MAG: alpha/beta hydrolase [Polyangia bacterium]